MHRRLAASVLSLSLLWPVGAAADGALPDVATPVQREQAQARFVRGRELMNKKSYDQALVEFRASHEIVASPNTRLEIARCLRAAGKLVAAYAELGRTSVEAKELLAQDNRYQKALDAAVAERKEIEPQLGFVILTVQNATDDTKITIDGEELRRAAWAEPVPVTPANSQIVVTTPGHGPVTQTVTVAAGQKQSLTIDALAGAPDDTPQPTAPPPAADTAPPSSSDSMRRWSYVAGGVGAAGLLTFTIFGLIAKSTYDDLNSACQGGPCPSSKSGEISSGKTQQTVANVGLVLGALGLGTGVTLFVLSMPKSEPAAPKGEPASTSLVLSPGWAGVAGRF
jgi:hypothetical protein